MEMADTWRLGRTIAELNGDRRHDAYPEQLRRSVEAIKDYNADLHSDAQFAITGSLLRQLTKVKPSLVKKWMEDNSDDPQSYAGAFCINPRKGAFHIKTFKTRIE